MKCTHFIIYMPLYTLVNFISLVNICWVIKWFVYSLTWHISMGDTYRFEHDHRYSKYTSFIFNLAQIWQPIVIRCSSPTRLTHSQAVTSPCAAIMAYNVPAVIGLCKGTVSGLWKRWKFPPVTRTHDPLGFRKPQTKFRWTNHKRAMSAN